MQRQLPGGLDDRPISVRPIKPVPSERLRAAILDDEHGPVPVELDLVKSSTRPPAARGPARAAWEGRRQENSVRGAPLESMRVLADCESAQVAAKNCLRSRRREMGAAIAYGRSYADSMTLLSVVRFLISASIVFSIMPVMSRMIPVG